MSATWTSSRSAIHGCRTATNTTANATALAAANAVSSRLRSGRSVPPAVPRENGDDEECRDEPQVRRDVPIGRDGDEARKPAERVHAERYVEQVLQLLLERVVERARGHRREQDCREGAHADEDPDKDAHPPVAYRRETVGDERRYERNDLDEVTVGR